MPDSLDWESVPYCEIDEDDRERFALAAGDIVVARTGATVGYAKLIRESVGAVFASYLVRFRVNTELADPAFVGRLVESHIYKSFVQSRIGGAAQPNASAPVLGAFEFVLPPRQSQGRIADILSAYDDLIENNRRRMALLEEAARQLYREWFVRLRFPGHEHTLITNGVPDGWERRVFADACTSLEDGDWIETKDQGGDDYRLLQISNIGVGEFVETGNFRYISEQTFNRLNCRALLPGHILISRMPKPIGRAWLVTEMPWRMITAVDGAIAVANEQVADPYFLVYFLNSPTSLEHCERRAVGATRARIARRELAMLPLLLPVRRLQGHFRDFVEPLNQQRSVLYRQNDKLRAARDLLLPRLMSGALAV